MHNASKNITILGSAHPLRGGGISTFNERLATALQESGDQVQIFSFSLQYPSLFFPGKTQFTTEPPPKNLVIHSVVNSINPFNWLKIGKRLKKLRPDIIIVRYWTPFMAPCFGTILRQVKKNHYTKVICIADNIIPHEKHFVDTAFTNYFIKPVDSFITMSHDVLKDVQSITSKPSIYTPHPLYDNYGDIISKEEACKNLGLNANEKYFLFFGFIRAYKGLDLLIEAFFDKRLRQFPVKLLIAGEFYENEKRYLEMIKSYHLQDDIILHTKFISNDEVKNYFCASDLIVQPYISATQSGVTQIGYHFEKPMLVTNVGGLAEIIPNGKVGYVIQPKSNEIADTLVDFLKNQPNFLTGIRKEKKKYSWRQFINAMKMLF